MLSCSVQTFAQRLKKHLFISCYKHICGFSILHCIMYSFVIIFNYKLDTIRMSCQVNDGWKKKDKTWWNFAYYQQSTANKSLTALQTCKASQGLSLSSSMSIGMWLDCVTHTNHWLSRHLSLYSHQLTITITWKFIVPTLNIYRTTTHFNVSWSNRKGEENKKTRNTFTPE